MSVIEDSPKLMQDFLAPELRAISVRADALEKKVDEVDARAEKRHVVALAKIDDTERRTDKRFDQVDKRFDLIDQRFEQLLTAIGSLADYNVLRERVARLETGDRPHQ